MKRTSRLSAMWYVLAPQELLASHPMTRKVGESQNPTGDEPSSGRATSASASNNFARLSGLPVGGSANSDASTATLTTTDGSEIPKARVFSPFPVGGFFSLESEDAVCELILQWFEDSEVLRRRNANLVTISSDEGKVGGNDAASGGTPQPPSQTKKNNAKQNGQIIQLQFPTVVEYDDVDVLNYVEMNLSAVVVMEPRGGPKTGTATSANLKIDSAEGDEEETKAALLANPSPFAQSEDQPYTFHGQRWLNGALLRFFQRQASIAEQQDGL